MEFIAKTYGRQNMEGHTTAWDDPVLLKMTSSFHPMVLFN
jgi:hypothetical protein